MAWYMYLGFFLLVLLLIFIGIVLYIVYNATKIPENSPKNYLENKNKDSSNSDKKNIVFAGDSITHGRVTYNYIDLVQNGLGQKSDDYEFINAGINSQTVWNLLQRLDEIIACKPEYIFILIGTNDAFYSTTKIRQIKHKIEMKLPQYPSIQWFEENYKELLTRLKNETQAKIAVFSLPTMSENENLPIFQRGLEFNKLIFSLAKEFNVTYLPLEEKMIEKLNAIPTNNRNHVKWYANHQVICLIIVVWKHYILKKSYEQISNSIGLIYHSDKLHMNQNGAKIISDLILSVLLSS